MAPPYRESGLSGQLYYIIKSVEIQLYLIFFKVCAKIKGVVFYKFFSFLDKKRKGEQG